jgi:hypothetical protein
MSSDDGARVSFYDIRSVFNMRKFGQRRKWMGFGPYCLLGWHPVEWYNSRKRIAGNRRSGQFLIWYHAHGHILRNATYEERRGSRFTRIIAWPRRLMDRILDGPDVVWLRSTPTSYERLDHGAGFGTVGPLGFENQGLLITPKRIISWMEPILLQVPKSGPLSQLDTAFRAIG